LSGRGNFSDVHVGILSLPIGKIPVAVKTPKCSIVKPNNRKAWKKEETDRRRQRKLLRDELAIMIRLQVKSGGHDNLLKLIGAITKSRTDFCILIEYCELGSVDRFLQEKFKNSEFIDEIICEENSSEQFFMVKICFRQ
jgi:serine/threonine protein kinase